MEFINNAKPTIIRPTQRQKPVFSDEVTVVIPDIQIGQYNGENFHDERAMKAAQMIVRELVPDNVLFIGDALDFTPMSRFSQRPGWQDTVQYTLDRFHEYLAETRANAPDANIIYLNGNHEARLEKKILEHNAELLGIKRANAANELGVLSIASLLRLDELEVEHIEAYPGGRYYLEDNLQAMHGNMSRASGSTAGAMVRREDISTLFGHTHRIEVAHRRVADRVGRIIVAASFGALCRIDGAVPSGSFSTDEHDQISQGYTNWQHGVGVVFHNERTHQINPIHIQDGEYNLFGETYQA